MKKSTELEKIAKKYALPPAQQARFRRKLRKSVKAWTDGIREELGGLRLEVSVHADGCKCADCRHLEGTKLGDVGDLDAIDTAGELVDEGIPIPGPGPGVSLVHTLSKMTRGAR